MNEYPSGDLQNADTVNVFHHGLLSKEFLTNTDQDFYHAYLRYRALYEMARLLNSPSRSEAVIQTCLETMIKVVNAERGLLLLFDPAGKVKCKFSHKLSTEQLDHTDFMTSRSLIAHVMETRKEICIPNVRENDFCSKYQNLARLQILSIACIPLLLDKHLQGIVYVDNLSRIDAFGSECCSMLREFAGLVSQPLALCIQQEKIANPLVTRAHQHPSAAICPAIIGTSPQIQRVLKFINQVADTTATVIVEGESGTGKELVARALHEGSRRRDKPFVSLNCGALTETLLESELFGHIKGSFTGAVQNRKGWFETANGGTIFFDEISEMSPCLQVKLLRILQTGEYSPVGSNEIKKSDVRIIVATNRHLQTMVRQGSFRSDLYYRLNILYLHIPPLRERREDILRLAEYYLQYYGSQLGKEHLRLSIGVQEALANYDFPGNIRELQNIMQRAAVITESVEVQLPLFPESFFPEDLPADDAAAHNFATLKKAVVERFEKEYLATALDKSHGSIAQAARFAGIDPKNFYQKMQKYQIKPIHW